MTKEWLRKLSPVMEWTAWICGILGTSIFGVFKLALRIFGNPEVAKWVGIIFAFAALTAYFIIRSMKYRRQIDELNKRILACKKAIMTIDKGKLTEFTPVDYYLIDKDVYDGFKTKLKITDCLLEVKFLENTENPKEYDYEFKWILTVKNPSAEPESMAKFIYSGAKEGEEAPRLYIESTDIVIDKYEKKGSIRVLREDDCFEEISFADGLKRGKDVKITIKYVFKKYKFNPKKIRIWLVPDALGFAGMDKFCIRFRSDGKIVHEDTNVVLNSYKLNEEYDPEGISNIDFDKDNKWFEARSGKREKLHGYGYQLVLTND